MAGSILVALLVCAVSAAASAQTPQPAVNDAAGGNDDEDDAYVAPAMLRFRPLLHRELLVYRMRGDGVAGSVPEIDHTVRALLGAPLYRGPVLTLDVILEYQYDRHHGPLVGALLGPQAMADDEALELHRFELELPVHLSFSEVWAMELGVRPIYAGDLESHDPEAWLPFARVNAAWRFDDDWAFLFGAVTARISSVGWLALPLLGVYYRPVGGPFQFDALLPSRIEARWWAFDAVPDLHLFAHTDFRGFEWHVREAARVNRSRLDASVGARWGFWWPLELEARVGSNLLQFTALDPDSASEALREESWLDGPTFTLSAGIVVRTD